MAVDERVRLDLAGARAVRNGSQVVHKSPGEFGEISGKLDGIGATLVTNWRARSKLQRNNAGPHGKRVIRRIILGSADTNFSRRFLQREPENAGGS